MSAGSLKAKLDGNDLDLSFMCYKDIPVEEIAVLPKVKSVDLSCNCITNIPETFCRLRNIVKLDLSKNRIESLPYNFGTLTQLRHLDLYDNKIDMLPISFAHLKSLNWLDLKNNPLDSQLKKIAGDCQDSKQCTLCARKVVSFMQSVEKQLIRQKTEDSNAIQQDDEDRESKVAADKQERHANNAVKKLTKEKKTLTEKVAAERADRRKVEKVPINNRQEKVLPRPAPPPAKLQVKPVPVPINGKVKQQKQPIMKQKKKGGCWHYLSMLLALAFLLASSCASLLCLYTGGDISGPAIREALPRISMDIARLVEYGQLKLKDAFVWSSTVGLEYVKIASGHVSPILQDVGHVFVLSWNHVHRQLQTFVLSPATMTTTTPNIKNM